MGRPVPGTALRSPLAHLHPRGHAGAEVVLGSGAPPWRGALTAPTATSSDFVLVVPTPSECLRPGWLTDALARARGAASGGGMGWILVPRRWRGGVERKLRASGDVRVEAFALLPSAASPAVAVPLAAGPLRTAFRDATSLPGTVRGIAAGAVRLRPVRSGLRSALPSVGFVVTAANTRPAAWLGEASASEIPLRHVTLRPGWRGGDAAAVLFGFSDASGDPCVVAKAAVGPASAEACRREAAHLTAFRDGAEATGARVPRLVELADLGGLPAAVQTALPGTPAAAVLRARPAQAGGTLRLVADFLLRWNLGTREERPLSGEALHRWIEEPLRHLAPELPEGYAERVRAEAEALRGVPVPLVVAHHDLTASNVLLARGLPPGLVDWEEAEGEALPLTDLFYCGVDMARAATQGTRADALRACFAPDGRYAPTMHAALRAHADALGLAPAVVRLAFQAGWLRHARNEALAASGGPSPFLEALRWAAAHPYAPTPDER